jgi:hypothetical protein
MYRAGHGRVTAKRLGGAPGMEAGNSRGKTAVPQATALASAVGAFDAIAGA